jgi:hypothetical protein
MATVTKDFRIKSGLVVEGTNGTINGSDIITEDAITGGTQTNISVTYNPTTKLVDFVAENGVADSTTADLAEDPAATTSSGTMYFTNQRAIDAVGGSASSENTPNSVVKRDGNGDFSAGEITGDLLGNVTGDLLGNVDANGGTIINVIDPTDDQDAATKKYVDDELNSHADTITGVHGVNGDVVGTTDTQELQNKTLTTPVHGNNLDADQKKVVNLGTPTADQDAANKAYVDQAISGLAWKESVHLFADANVALTGTTGTLVIDGHDPLVTADEGIYRLLLIGQSDATQNGIYLYTDDGANYVLVRTTDADTVDELIGAAVFVKEGDVYAATSWVQTSYSLTTFDDLAWVQFSGSGTVTEGLGIDISGREISVDLSELSTTTLPEGDNKYFLDERVDDRVAALVSAGTGIATNYDDEGNLLTLSADFSEFDTSDVVEDPDGTGTSGTLYFTDARAVSALEAVTPNFTEIDINSVATQVAASVSVTTAGQAVAYSFAKTSYRSAKFLVKVAYSSHTEVSEVIITLDTSDNIAITEYAVVGTNGSASTISAGINSNNVELLVTTQNDNSTVTVVGTLLV